MEAGISLIERILMKGLTKATVKKHVKETFTNIFESGFLFYRADTLLRTRKMVLQSIQLHVDSLNRSVTPIVSIMPLFRIDGMIDYLHSIKHPTIIFDEKVEEEFEKMYSSILQEGIPFLEAASSLEMIVSPSFLGKYPDVIGNDIPSKKTLCYCYAYLGKADEFIAICDEVIESTMQHPGAWAKEEGRFLQTIKKNLHDYQLVRAKLNKKATDSVNELGLLPYLDEETKVALW